MKISKHLMLETAELKRNQEFIDSANLVDISSVTSKYGVIRNIHSDPNFNNFKIEAGTNSGTIKLQEDSYAVDSDGLIISMKAFDNLSIPNNGLSHYITIEHQFSPVEVGTVSVSNDGTLTGIGTAFTQVLRGQPHFPSKIKFYGSSLNLGEYTVNEVISDTVVILSGQFIPESGITYSVIGTFSPTALIPSQDKEIFQYDSCLMKVIVSGSYLPLLPLPQGKQFTIAVVSNSGGIITVGDMRSGGEMYTTADMSFIDETPKITNALIGVESVKYDNQYGTKEKNEVSIAWGFRSDNFTIDPTSRTMTILSGEGGKFKSSSDFASGDFDGWRIYNNKGDYKRIISSVKVSTSIRITIESMRVIEFQDPYVLIVPDVETVIIRAKSDGAGADIEQIHSEHEFPVNTEIGKIWLLVPASPSYLYNIAVRYRRFNRYSDWEHLPSDSVGYYDETSFDSNGVLNVNPIDRNRVPYVAPLISSQDGYITLLLNPSAYLPIIQSIATGDRLGVEHVTLNPSAVQPHTLTVGSSRMYQSFEGTLNLTQDIFINISPTGAVNGNIFVLKFSFTLALSGFRFRIVTDYVNTTTFTLIDELDGFDQALMNLSTGFPIELWLRFDGVGWTVDHSTWDRSQMKWQSILIATNASGISANSAAISAINSAWVDHSSSVTFEMTDNLGAVSTIGSMLPKLRYKIVGKTCYIQYFVQVDTITTNTGTSWKYVDMSLPPSVVGIAAFDQHGFMMHGRATSSQFFQTNGVAIIKAGTSKVRLNAGISENDDSPASGSNTIFSGSMTFEIQ